MKKLLALALVLILIGPAIALACGCCHSEELSSTGVSIGNERCSDCSVTNFNRDKSSVSRSESALASPESLTFQSVLNEAQSSAGANHPSSLIASSPPSSSSETPLYLSQQNLRL